MSTKKSFNIALILKGFAMGIAEIIPGVSGGTIAFITGIYEELINTIKGINPSLISVLRSQGLQGFWKAVNGNFLLKLMFGMFVGIGIGIFLIGFLLENYQAPLWAFFFGLIISSAIYIGRKIEKWKVLNIFLLVAGMTLAYSISILTPAEGSSNYFAVLFSGMIAISAMILPGISGSFILLLLGMYTIIRREAEIALTTFEWNSILIIVVFGIGCILGLALFSRMLSFTFKNYKDQTLAILTGFMMGSLFKIWPWRNPVSWLDKASGVINTDLSNMNKELLLSDHIQLIRETNVMPSQYLFFESQTLLCLATFLIGLIIVFVLEYRQKQNSH